MSDSNVDPSGSSETAASAWLDYRRARRINFALLLGGLPLACVLVIMLASARFSAHPLAVFFVVWIAALTVSGIRVVTFRCPRCRRLFFVKNALVLHWARNCRHCGLPKWAGVVGDAQIGNQQPATFGVDLGMSLVAWPAARDPIAATARALFATGFFFATIALGSIVVSMAMRAILHSAPPIDPAAAELAQGILDVSLVHGPRIIAASGLLLVGGIAVMRRHRWGSWLSRVAVAALLIIYLLFMFDSKTMLRNHDHRAHQGPWARAGARLDAWVQSFGTFAMALPLLGGAIWLWRRIDRVERALDGEPRANQDIHP